MNISEVREELADVLDDIPGLRAKPNVPDQVNPPLAYVDTVSLNYRYDLSPSGMFATLAVVLLVSSADSKRGQDALDEYLSSEGDRSIYQKVSANTDLNGTCDWAQVSTADEVGLYEVAGSKYVGARLLVEVAG